MQHECGMRHDKQREQQLKENNFILILLFEVNHLIGFIFYNIRRWSVPQLFQLMKIAWLLFFFCLKRVCDKSIKSFDFSFQFDSNQNLKRKKHAAKKMENKSNE